MNHRIAVIGLGLITGHDSTFDVSDELLVIDNKSVCSSNLEYLQDYNFYIVNRTKFRIRRKEKETAFQRLYLRRCGLHDV